jgi:hypothetical protein
MLPCLPKRLVVARHRVDFRKQWNGLLAESYHMGFDPYQGDCIIFIKKDRTQLRALWGDSLGLLLIARRFDAGSLRLSWLFDDAAKTQRISAAELTLFLEGATCTVGRQIKAWKKDLPDNL